MKQTKIVYTDIKKLKEGFDAKFEKLKPKKQTKTKERTKEFLDCLGNGKSIYECESDNDIIDDLNEELK